MNAFNAYILSQLLGEDVDDKLLLKITNKLYVFEVASWSSWLTYEHWVRTMIHSIDSVPYTMQETN